MCGGHNIIDTCTSLFYIRHQTCKVSVTSDGRELLPRGPSPRTHTLNRRRRLYPAIGCHKFNGLIILQNTTPYSPSTPFRPPTSYENPIGRVSKMKIIIVYGCRNHNLMWSTPTAGLHSIFYPSGVIIHEKSDASNVLLNTLVSVNTSYLDYIYYTSYIHIVLFVAE